MSSIYEDELGKTYRLGRELGVGGEGRVFSIQGRKSLVAKIYQYPTRDRERKLRAMLLRPPADPALNFGHRSICWPINLLFGATGFSGFTMPRVDLDNNREAQVFYNPRSRRSVSPDFTWKYCVRTARNLARVVTEIHRQKHIVGDLNCRNVFVATDTRVTFVDCDSMQVRDANAHEVFRCPAAMADFTAPELHGLALATIDRDQHHDSFSLAVLIFLFLMEGIHPFMVRHGKDGSGSDIVENIKLGLFPYSSGSARLPPRIAPPFDILPKQIQQLFVRSFQKGPRNIRPAAEEWQVALGGLESDLRSCGANPRHTFSGHLRSCPWCDRKKKFGGFDPYPSPTGQGQIPWNRPAASPKVPSPSPLPLQIQVPPKTPKTGGRKVDAKLVSGVLLVLLLGVIIRFALSTNPPSPLPPPPSASVFQPAVIKANVVGTAVLATTIPNWLQPIFSGQALSAANYPPVPPIEINDRCPGDQCTYGPHWLAAKDLPLFDESSQVISSIAERETVTAMGGRYFVLTPGLDQVLQPFSIDGVMANPGDFIYVLMSLGEGWARVVFYGKIIDCQLYGMQNPLTRNLLQAQTEWWAQIRTSLGVVGWTHNAEAFDGKDHSGIFPYLDVSDEQVDGYSHDFDISFLIPPGYKSLQIKAGGRRIFLLQQEGIQHFRSGFLFGGQTYEISLSADNGQTMLARSFVRIDAPPPPQQGSNLPEPDQTPVQAPTAQVNPSSAGDQSFSDKQPSEPKPGPTISVWASHKHLMGSCSGQLQFSSTSVRFISSVHPFTIFRSSIKRQDHNGFIDANGKAWHFSFDDKSIDPKAFFRDWLDR
jgi:hypothetical protein